MTFKQLLKKPFKYAYWNIALILIGINLMVFLLTSSNSNLVPYLALNPLLVLKKGLFWQVFTYQFVHGSFSHLFSNMIGLFFFGMSLERHPHIGSKEFLFLYLLSGTLCGVFSLLLYWFTGTWYVFLMGASGAIFAVLLVYAVSYPRSIIYLWAFIPIPAPMLVIGYAAYEIFNLLLRSNSGIAHSAHLIGFGIAWLYCIIRLGVNPIRIWKNK